MPYPSQHLRVTWSGDGWAQQETWSTGLRLDGTSMPDASQLEALEVAFLALMQGDAAKTSSNVRYLAVKVAPQDVNGLYGASGQSAERIRPTPAGTAWAYGLPQATMAVTLTTATPRGLANEGRMYLPATSLVPSGDGRITLQEGQALAQAVVTFINSVDAVGLGNVSVFSKGTPTNPAGAKRDVTGVRVGRVVDTQRRRRNSIAEEYVSASTGN